MNCAAGKTTITITCIEVHCSVWQVAGVTPFGTYKWNLNTHPSVWLDAVGDALTKTYLFNIQGIVGSKAIDVGSCLLASCQISMPIGNMIWQTSQFIQYLKTAAFVSVVMSACLATLSVMKVRTHNAAPVFANMRFCSNALNLDGTCRCRSKALNTLSDYVASWIQPIPFQMRSLVGTSKVRQ